jgi:hypothetical protein
MVEQKSRHQSVAKEEKRKKLIESIGGTGGGRNISNQDIKNILKNIGGTGGRAISALDIKNILKNLGVTASKQAKLKSQLSKFKLTNKKGKPHLKKGGKAKKMKAYSKGGKV